MTNATNITRFSTTLANVLLKTAYTSWWDVGQLILRHIALEPFVPSRTFGWIFGSHANARQAE